MDQETDAAPQPDRPALSWLAFFLYLPLAGALGGLVLLCLLLLLRRQTAGLYGVLYGAFFFVVARRMSAIRDRRARGSSLWKDVVLACAADLFLCVLAASWLLR